MCVVPSTVYEVVEFDSKEPEEPVVLYKKSKYIPFLYESSWCDGFPETANVTDDSVLLIKGWNQTDGKVQSFFLNSHHLCEALGLKSVHHMWALSDMGIMTQLSCYMKQMKHQMHDILDLQVPVFHHDKNNKDQDGIRWKDITSDLSPYLKSLQLRENVTADDVIMLYKYIQDQQEDIEQEDVMAHKIKIVDYELECKEVDGHSFCFTSNDK
jgi:hypothetical protein